MDSQQGWANLVVCNEQAPARGGEQNVVWGQQHPAAAPFVCPLARLERALGLDHTPMILRVSVLTSPVPPVKLLLLSTADAKTPLPGCSQTSLSLHRLRFHAI